MNVEHITSIEIATLVGSFGLFFTLFLLFCRFLPVIAVAEVKGVLKYGRPAAEPMLAPAANPARAAAVAEGVHV